MDEYISKQKVLDYLNGYLHSLGEGGADTLLFDRGQRRALINSIQDISAVKAADVQPVKHGHWIEHPDDIFPLESTIECSECGEQENVNIHNDNFCPNCGARMDGDIN